MVCGACACACVQVCGTRRGHGICMCGICMCDVCDVVCVVCVVCVLSRVWWGVWCGMWCLCGVVWKVMMCGVGGGGLVCVVCDL